MQLDWGVIIFIAVVCGVVAGFIWQSKGGEFGTGFAMGGLLGIIGIAIAAFARPSTRRYVPPANETGSARVRRFLFGDWRHDRVQETMKTCPHCAEPIRQQARVCPHCQRDVE